MNIVITGSSHGIGYHTALQLSKNGGHKIFGLSRDKNGLRKLSEAIGADSEFYGIPCDITSEKSVEEAVQSIAKVVSLLS